MNTPFVSTPQRYSYQTYKFSILTLSTLLLGIAWTPSANAVVVNCGSGGTGIQAQLNLGNDVDFTGTCAENAFLLFDGQYLKSNGTGVGGAGGGTIKGTVGAFRVVGVTLEGFKVQDPTVGTAGVYIGDGAHAKITNVTFDDISEGFAVYRNSFADINGLVSTTQTSPLLDGNGNSNVSVYQFSGVRMKNSTITNNVSSEVLGGPVYASQFSYIAIRGGNTITNTGSVEAIGAYNHSHLREDNNTINTTPATGNTIVGTTVGFRIDDNSSLDLRQATVTAPDNYVEGDSVLRIGSDSYGGDPSNISISGDVTASQSSTLLINTNAEMEGDVICESFSTLDNHSLSGAGNVNCPYVIVTQAYQILDQERNEQKLLLDESGDMYLAGTFNPASSRKIKKGFEDIESTDILDRIMEVPITKWSYKRDENSLQHIGPMSEDFYAAFGLGRDDKTISTTDASGIALAAIQGIKKQKDAEIAELKGELTRLNLLIEKLASENLLVIPSQ